GSPAGGEWTAGGGTGGEVAGIDPELTKVGGDPWNQETARRLAIEYAKAKPAIEAIASQIGRTMKLADMTSEEQALFKTRYVAAQAEAHKKELVAHYGNSEASIKSALAVQKEFFAKPENEKVWLTSQVEAYLKEAFLTDAKWTPDDVVKHVVIVPDSHGMAIVMREQGQVD